MAATSRVSVDKLAERIAEELSTYSKEIVEKIDASSERIGKETVKTLKKTSPKRYGDYAKRWTMTTTRVIGLPDVRTIHVRRPDYRLTHLLEHGHAKRGGGRVEARPHIEPAEKEMIEKFTTEVGEAIKHG